MTTEVANMLKISDAAKYLNINPWTIREMLRKRELKGYKVKNRWRIKLSDIEEYLQSRSNK